MKVTGQYIIKLNIELSDTIHIPYDDLKNFFYGEDLQFYEDIIEYERTTFILDDNSEIPLLYLPIFEYLSEIDILKIDKKSKYFDEREVSVQDFNLFIKEMEKIKELTTDILNNYKAYVRDFIISNEISYI